MVTSNPIRDRHATTPGGMAVFLLLIFIAAVLYAASATTQAQPATPCCSDRWDPAREQRGHWGPGRMGEGQRQRMARHWTFMHEGVPAEYAGQENPFESSADVVSEGGQLYATHCALCHGSEGLGDGLIANSLSPSPALLARLIQMPMAVDAYLLWSISEGGQAFGTDMPAFKDVLSEEDIWKIISYLRAGLPSMSEDSSGLNDQDIAR